MASLIENKKAHFSYEITDKFEAGVELFGHEVKSIRAHLGSLEGAFVSVRGNEAFLLNSHIPPFQPKNTPKEYDSERARKLLLTKKEIETLKGVESKKGLTIVPMSVYNKGRFIKILVGIGRGKKKFDKRETIKKRDTLRDVRRELKDR